MRRTLLTTFVVVGTATVLTACTASGQQDEEFISAEERSGTATPGASDEDDDGLEVVLRDAQNAEVGTAWVTQEDGGVEIEVAVGDLEPGFHGFHLHAVGLCEPDSADPTDPAKVGDFLSAGGHVGADAADHGAHAGDLPALLVESDGSADVTVRTDGVTLDELLDDDGTVLMIHADRDNLAHIPERYAPGGPDEETLKTGDAGGRIVCGVIEE